jgi:2-methylaconitate cis-trans-isomerase PrpF
VIDHVIDATWMRGGTSKCWIFDGSALPDDVETASAMLSRLFGSPDRRQIDGIGGGTVTTSKAILIDPPTRSPVVTYRLALVNPASAHVEWTGNCGNCASAVGLYAAERGFVAWDDGVARMRLHNMGSGQLIDVEVPGPDAAPVTIPGTAFPGRRVDLRFTPDTWSATAATFPTGSVVDTLWLDGREYRASLVDAGNLCAFIAQADLPLGTLDVQHPDFAQTADALVRLRLVAGGMMGCDAATSEANVKIGVVGAGGQAATGQSQADLTVRMMSGPALHAAVPVTVAVGLAVAATHSGTTVSDAVAGTPRPEQPRASLAIATDSGVVTARMRYDGANLSAVLVERSARTIAHAELVVPGNELTTHT